MSVAMPPTEISSGNNNEEMRFKFPYDIVDLEPELNKRMLKEFTGEKKGFLQVGPKKYFMPSKYRQFASDIYNFNVRKDDVWIVTFPRSGTTWTQEMTWLIANDLDFQRSADVSLLERFPFLEYSMCVAKEIKEELMAECRDDREKIEIIQNMDLPMWKELAKVRERRFIKTHLPLSLLPPDLLTAGCKVIYIARHPKDVAISFYHLNKFMRTQGYHGNFKDYWNYFESNLQHWTPYWEHVKEAWNLKDSNNLLFMFYEDIKRDIRGSIDSIAAFLDKHLTAHQVEQLVAHVDITNFRSNPSVNHELLNRVGVSNNNEEGFIRTGKSGDWQDYFDDVLDERADNWIAANSKDCDIRFPKAVK